MSDRPDDIPTLDDLDEHDREILTESVHLNIRARRADIFALLSMLETSAGALARLLNSRAPGAIVGELIEQIVDSDPAIDDLEGGGGALIELEPDQAPDHIAAWVDPIEEESASADAVRHEVVAKFQVASGCIMELPAQGFARAFEQDGAYEIRRIVDVAEEEGDE